MRKVYPSYLSLHQEGKLAELSQQLDRKLYRCDLCAHNCKVNRLEGEKGFCRAPGAAIYDSAVSHYGEEAPISGSRGSGTIFFTYCNGRCLFCQNYEISQRSKGNFILIEDLAHTYLKLQRKGCHNINFVTPAHFLPQIVAALEIAVDLGFDLPLVYNSNGYDSVDIIRMIEGVFDIYLPDMKFGDETIARKLTKMPNYPEKTANAIREMFRQVGPLELDENGIARKGMIVRHLVLPNDRADTAKVMAELAGISTDINISLIGYYSPAYLAYYERGINRSVTHQEFEKAHQITLDAGLKNVEFTDSFLMDSG